jgi:hypothetical protein
MTSDFESASNSSLSSSSNNQFAFYVFESLIVIGAFAVAAFTLTVEDPKTVVYGVVGLLSLILLLILNRKSLNNLNQKTKQLENQKKAELYSYLTNSTGGNDVTAINLIRSRAIQYSQELIDDYKKIRQNSRNFYYIFQISTIVLSSLTPILVLLDKVDVSIPAIKWLPVIFPAIAAIVTSISTSFPLQETWVSANTAVELLEAEQEKFILGVTADYRFYDLADDPHQQKQKVLQSVESFMLQVNQIHLKQVQQSVKPEKNTDSNQSSAESNS